MVEQRRVDISKKKTDNVRKNTIVILLLALLSTAKHVQARKRASEPRTTEDIIIGCCVLSLMLIIIAISVLYCRFCTRRKRQERRLQKLADIEESNNKGANIIEVQTYSKTQKSQKNTNTAAWEDTKSGDTSIEKGGIDGSFTSTKNAVVDEGGTSEPVNATAEGGSTPVEKIVTVESDSTSKDDKKQDTSKEQPNANPDTPRVCESANDVSDKASPISRTQVDLIVPKINVSPPLPVVEVPDTEDADLESCKDVSTPRTDSSTDERGKVL